MDLDSPAPTPAADARRDLRVAAEAILREVTGAERVSRLCPRCGSGVHGQPRLVGSGASGLSVSLSYADGLVAVAWGTGPVGVDVEARRHGSPRGHDPGVDLADWTRTEALAKAAGTGLRRWPDVAPPTLPTRSLPDLPRGYVGTVAGRAEVRLAGPAVASP